MAERMENVRIAQATDDNLDTLCAIGARCFQETFAGDNTAADMQGYLDESFSWERVAEELHNPDSSFTIVYVGAQPAGYLKTNVGSAQTEVGGDDALEVERIYILKAYKGLGLGGRLMDLAFEQAERQGKNRIWLGVWEHNDAARGFYEHRGFTVIGDHVFQLGTDAQRDLIMERAVE